MTLTSEYQYIGRSNAVKDQNSKYSYYILLYAKTSADVASGRHTVTVKQRLVSTVGNTFYGYSTSGRITIAGTTTTEWSWDHVPDKPWDIADVTEDGVTYPTGVDICEGTLEIDVGYGKTKDVVLSTSWTFVSGSAGYLPTPYASAEVSATVTLDKIAGISQPSASSDSVELGQNVTIYTNRIAGAGLTHTIDYQFGSVSGTIAADVADSVVWTPALDLASQIPNAVSGTAIITCTTYASGVAIGSKQMTLTLIVPETVLPKASAIWEDTSGAFELFDTLVQNFSRLSVTVSGTGIYGSTVIRAEVKLNGAVYNGGILADAGELSIDVSVTDSRGRVGLASYAVNVAPYAIPSFTLSASRCTADGSADDTGDHAIITVTGYVTQVNDRNVSELALTWGSESETVSLPAEAITYQKIVYADPDVPMNISAQLSDALASINREMVLSTGYATMDLLAGGKGISMGKAATREGFDCAMPAYFSGGLHRAYDDGSFDDQSIFERIDELESGKELSDGQNLNTLTTPGVWYGRAGGNYANCPVDSDFTIEVLPAGANGQLTHRLSTGGPIISMKYERFYVSDEWLSWGVVSFESRWQTAGLTSSFTSYNQETPPVYRRTGNVVQIKGVMTPVSTLSSSVGWVTITTLPEAYRPTDAGVECVQQGDGNALWFLRITTGGMVQFSRYQADGNFSDAAAGIRLPINATFLVPAEAGNGTSVDDINATVADALASMEEKAANSIAAVERRAQTILDEADATIATMAELVAQVAPAIVCETAGVVLQAANASDLPLRKLRLLGKTTLSGTPTPTAPAVMDSVPESVTVSINDGQDLTLTVAQPLRGIPMQAVCTKHNYTDTSGQKWFTDEIDLARGVYIQRCFTLAFDGTEAWYLSSAGDPCIGHIDLAALKNFDIGAVAPDNGYCAYHMCSHFQSVPRNGSKPNGTVNAFGGARGNTLQFKTDTYNGDLEGWKQWLADQAAAGTPVTMLLGMKTPVETALPEEVIQAYKALHTIKGETIIGNDASAYMEASYVADTKLYIDQKLAAISAALLNN